MISHDQANLGNNILPVLRGTRRRWWVRSLVDAALGALLLASAAVAAGWLLAWMSGPGPGQSGTTTLLSLAAFGAVAGFVAWLLVAALRSPSLLAIATRIDRLFGQADRFSTSYEVIKSGGPANVVTKSLLADVEGRAQRLGVGTAGWWRGSGTMGWSAVVAAVVAGVLLVVPVPSRPTSASVQASSDIASVHDRSAEAATLAGMAELLDLIAIQEDSDYLRAVGASFAELAERIANGEVTETESSRVTQELEQHLQAASQEVGGRFASAIGEAFTNPAPRLDPQLGLPSAGVGGAVTTPTPSSAAAAGELLNTEFYEAITDLLEQFGEDAAAVGVRPQRPSSASSSSADSFYGGVLNAEVDPNAAQPQPALGRVDAEGAGAPAGAAERSSAAAGDAAGQGGAGLGSGSDTFLDLATQGGAVSALERNERDDGKFVEMELQPRASTAAASSVAPVTAAPTFLRADESAFSTRGIGAEYSDVVSRYFTPGSVVSGDRP